LRRHILLGFQRRLLLLRLSDQWLKSCYFGGLLLDWLRRKMRTWGAVVIVSVLFSLAHGIAIKSGLAGWLQCAYRVLMGIIAAALTVRFRSLRPSFVFHATINLIGVVGTVLESLG
jgi:hypothetical protein